MNRILEKGSVDTFMDYDIFFTGILYINPADLGWNPPVASWIDRREVQSEKANLTILFDKYLPSCLDTLRTRYHSAAHTAAVSLRVDIHAATSSLTQELPP